jgi:hypothetical protein
MTTEVVFESKVRVAASSGKDETTTAKVRRGVVELVSPRSMRGKAWDDRGVKGSDLVMNAAPSRLITALRWMIWPTEGHQYDETTRMKMSRER